MMNGLEAYFDKKGWNFKVKNGEYSLNQCPLCAAGPGHFYVNQLKEIFYCHKCSERGHILSLKKRLGDLPPISHISSYSKTKAPPKTIDPLVVEKYYKDLLDNPVALAYLTDQRGFSLETINKFRLGFNNGAIAIPHFKDGLCLNIKFRSIADKKYFREDGGPSVLFNLDNALRYQGEAIVTEGEFDAMALDQMGFPNVLAVTVGADTFPNEWIDDLEVFDQVYLCYDMDEAGQKGVEKAADKLGRYRCRNVLLPLKDVNDCLKAGFTYQEMGEILLRAQHFDSKLIKTPEAFFDKVMERHGGPQGVKTGWSNFDNLIGGLRPNELTILTGETGSGKTTWGVNLCFKLLTQGGEE